MAGGVTIRSLNEEGMGVEKRESEGMNEPRVYTTSAHKQFLTSLMFSALRLRSRRRRCWRVPVRLDPVTPVKANIGTTDNIVHPLSSLIPIPLRLQRLQSLMR